MDIKVTEPMDNEEEKDEPREQMANGHIINMEIGVGVYDVQNPDFFDPTLLEKKMNELPQSTEPIVQVDGLRNHELDSNSDSSSEGTSSD